MGDWFSEAAKYGAMGAGGGAAVGGPLGALIGGLGGFIGGAVSGESGKGSYLDQYGNAVVPGAEAAYDPSTARLGASGRRRYGALADAAAQRMGPQMEGATVAESGYADPQRQALEAIRATTQGRGQAQAQLQQGLEQSLEAQQAAAGAQRGVRLGSTQNMLAREGSRMRQEASMGSALTQMQAERDYAGAIGQARQQDMARALEQARLEQGAATTNLNADLQMRALNDNMVKFYRQMGLSVDEANRQAQMDMARLQSEVALGQMQSNAQREAAMINAGASTVAAVGQAAPAIAGAVSDRRAKKKVRRANSDVEKVLDALEAYSYEYKDKAHGDGKFVGIMAQDLEKGGSDAVRDEGGLKVVDVTRGLGTALAAAANLNKRLRAVEGKA